ncbi:TorD/DmsD family molecular chaperone [Shewanella halifaxensis]|uniref:TorD/DmsD family molecular chaperone n=1 Tax=Shewanella halifaxensis TaxID=271098 RepID=UPI000D5A151A|nr:molecular chaperone TorD family protein [Shewanella halifaxensis]
MTNELPYAARVCGIFHNIFYPLPNEPLLASLSQLTAQKLWPRFITSPDMALAQIHSSLEKDSLRTIESDFCQLFVAPSSMKAAPWGAIYTDSENLVCGSSTLAFSQFCQTKQIELNLLQKTAIDHIGLIFAVLAKLFESEDIDGVKTLLSQHLLPWSHRVIDAINEHAQTDFYKGFANLTEIFLSDWQQKLKITPKEMRLYK